MAAYPNDQSNLAGAIPVHGNVGSIPYSSTPLGYEQITSLSSATGLTVPAGATFAQIAISGAAVRWRDDGVAPTTSLGIPVPAGSQLSYSGNLAAIEFIAQAGSPILDISYYR